jgi:site-specific recombinase XerD
VVALYPALPGQASPKEATMDRSIEQLGQDLARANYAKTTQEKYVKTGQDLSRRFGRPVAELTREEIRTYVEEVTARGKSASWVVVELAALAFLYRKTLGQPEKVSFVTYPRRHRPLPTVLSLEEVGALLMAIRHPTYQAVVMVLYGSGLRITEALALEVRDVDGSRGVLHVRHGKGTRGGRQSSRRASTSGCGSTGVVSVRRRRTCLPRARRANRREPRRSVRRSSWRPSRHGSTSM